MADIQSIEPAANYIMVTQPMASAVIGALVTGIVALFWVLEKKNSSLIETERSNNQKMEKLLEQNFKQTADNTKVLIELKDLMEDIEEVRWRKK